MNHPVYKILTILLGCVGLLRGSDYPSPKFPPDEYHSHDYHAVLTSYKIYNRLNRIGSFFLDEGEGPILVDLFFIDSNLDPQKQGFVEKAEVNGFELIALWRDRNSNWHWKSIIGGNRLMFESVDETQKNKISVNLKSPDFEIHEKMPPFEGKVEIRIEKGVLSFDLLDWPKTKLESQFEPDPRAQQDAAGQPATRLESK